MFNIWLLPTRMTILLLSMVLAACSNLPTGQPEGMDYSISLAGTRPGMQREFETIDLVGLLDPDDLLRLRTGGLPLGAQYDKALTGFAKAYSHGQPPKLRRNLVQNRIVAASDLRCGRFIQHLRSQGADTNFGLGVATTLFAAAAAVVPGVSDAKNLAALGALTSGARAEYNTEYFSNLSISLIVRSIQDLRAGLRLEIVGKQSELDYASYDVAAAVAEAIRYDASCNIINGLEHANEAVQRLQEPGREAVKRALLADQLNRAIDSGKTAEIDKYKEMLVKVQGINSTVANGLLRNSPSYAAQPLNMRNEQAGNAVYHLMDVENQTAAALQAAQKFMMDRLTGMEASAETPDPQKDYREKLKKSVGDDLSVSALTGRIKQCRLKATQLEGARMEAAYALEKSIMQPSEDRAANAEKHYALEKAELSVAQFNNFLDDFPQQVQTNHAQWLKDFSDEMVSKMKLTEFESQWKSKKEVFEKSLAKVDSQCPKPKE